MVKLPATETRNYRNELAEVLCGKWVKVNTSNRYLFDEEDSKTLTDDFIMKK